MRVKRFNEEIGFDDEELKSKFEIPNLMGEFEKPLKTFSKPVESENTKSFMRKVLYRFPVLERFHLKVQNIDNTEVYNYYATSLEPVDGTEFYVQLSLAYNNNQYYSFVVLRDLYEVENEENWYVRELTTENIEDTLNFVDAFLKASHGLNIVGKSQLEEDSYRNN